MPAKEATAFFRGFGRDVLACSNWWSWGKKGTPFIDIGVKELRHFPEPSTAPGETCFSLTGQKWFWNPNTRGYGSAKGVLDNLQTANARNSNLLLNVPPNRQGKFDDAAIKTLAELGKLRKEAAK